MRVGEAGEAFVSKRLLCLLLLPREDWQVFGGYNLGIISFSVEKHHHWLEASGEHFVSR